MSLLHKLSVVLIGALCVIGTSSLALADESLKSDMSQTDDDKKAVKGVQKAKSDAMERDMGRQGPVVQNREKMKAKRHEMMERMKAYREAAKTNSTAPAPVPAPAITPAP